MPKKPSPKCNPSNGSSRRTGRLERFCTTGPRFPALSPRQHRWRLVALLAALLPFCFLHASCAPAAEPARGEVGDQVQAAIESGTGRFDSSAWGDLLAAATSDGLIDYETMANRRGELDAYLGSVAEADLSKLSRDHLMALLINAYNAYTVTSILDHPDVDSIRQIDGVWDKATHRVGGFDLTLDNIEHNLLRPYFKDPRIHVAVNCASMSCAPLPPWAFDGDRLDQQLEEWTRDFFRNPKYLTLDSEEGVLRTSSLLDWYGEDFTKPDANPRADTLAGFIARFSTDEVRKFVEARAGKPEIRFLEYDWSLNQSRVD